ncbi:maleylpyruvate isomerase family mycothiol-dependent enzyme [Geodermatophilus sp. URMC 64]
MELDEYLPVLQRANARFAEVAAAAVLERGWTAHVPGCPDWTLADLVWHLTEVQHFWGWIVRTRAQDPSAYPEPQRRPDDELLGFLAASSAELETALDGAEPAEPVWTWAPRRDVAFVLRRQAQEAVVHTADVEQVLGELRPIPADVGLDGIDEWLEVFVPGVLPEGPPAGAHPVVLHAVDADAERTLFPGTRPFPIAALTGNAGDLLLALWHRLPMEVLTVDGDPAQAAAMIGLVTVE